MNKKVKYIFMANKDKQPSFNFSGNVKFYKLQSQKKPCQIWQDFACLI